MSEKEWIPVSERLPEENGEYEILVNGEPLDGGDEDLSPCIFDKKVGWLFDFYALAAYRVTHWKPSQPQTTLQGVTEE